MHLVSFHEGAGRGERAPSSSASAQPGILVRGMIVHLRAAWARAFNGDGDAAEQAPSSVIGLLQTSAEVCARVSEAATWISANGNTDRGRISLLSSVTLAAPVQRPGKIVCVGHNYRDHVEEVGRRIPTAPTLFSKPSTAIIGHRTPIIRPAGVRELDHEVELAVVIGRRARNLDVTEARQTVGGYTVMNDISARDLQRLTGQWFTGKAFDTSCPMGPVLVTADEISDPHNLQISCYVNGERRQNSNTRHLLFDVDYLVRYLSNLMTLEPGDVIATGTPGGVALGQDEPQWLRSGDTVTSEIESIGRLDNPIA